MGCGMSQEPQRRSHSSRSASRAQHHHGQRRHHELQHVSEPPSLAALGYETRISGTETDSEDADRVQVVYTITELGGGHHIMRVGINEERRDRITNDPDTLAQIALDRQSAFIQWFATENDSRDERNRPRGRDILTAFWVHEVERDLRNLRRVYFQSVVERTTRAAVRDSVCPLMGVEYNNNLNGPNRDINLQPPSRSRTAQNTEAWNLICENSRFVRLVAGMVRKYPGMARSRSTLGVGQINILVGINGLGQRNMFDLEVVLEDQ